MMVFTYTGMNNNNFIVIFLGEKLPPLPPTPSRRNPVSSQFCSVHVLQCLKTYTGTVYPACCYQSYQCYMYVTGCVQASYA